MNLKIGDTILKATMADNSSAKALLEILEKGPLTIDMKDYANMEKVGEIGKQLPTNDQQISARAGDIILYMGSALVIYYDNNSWNFTRLGKIEGVSQKELKEILGKGNVKVELYI